MVGNYPCPPTMKSCKARLFCEQKWVDSKRSGRASSGREPRRGEDKKCPVDISYDAGCAEFIFAGKNYRNNFIIQANTSHIFLYGVIFYAKK